MLERITDFMSHPDLIFGYVSSPSPSHCMLNVPSADQCKDPEERFLRVLQYYLAGWHIKPKGVKKPFVTGTSLSQNNPHPSLQV